MTSEYEEADPMTNHEYRVTWVSLLNGPNQSVSMKLRPARELYDDLSSHREITDIKLEAREIPKWADVTDIVSGIKFLNGELGGE